MDPPLDGAQRHPGHPDQGAGGHLPGGEQLVHRGVLRPAQHRRPQRGFPVRSTLSWSLTSSGTPNNAGPNTNTHAEASTGL
jgi:hypothetical protein